MNFLESNTVGYITVITNHRVVELQLEKKKDTIAKHYKDGRPVQLRNM
jgi:hypothetical protein